MHLFHQMKKVMPLARNQRRRQNPLRKEKKDKRCKNWIAYILYQCFKRALRCSRCWTERRDYFAFHIAGKLKKISRHTRILADWNLRFKIEMGEFRQHAEGRSTNHNNNFNVSGNPSSFQGSFMSALTNNNVNLL